MINYSIIIPHKNTPDLLQKCIDSIPRRNDVQIIVVDDNSDADKVDFDHFPGQDDPTVEVYLTKEGRGAGYAKNIGLDHAKGKWILLCGADDYFNPCISEAMDVNVDNDADVITFMATSVFLDGSPSNRCEGHNQRVKLALETGDNVPTILASEDGTKFFSHELINRHKIRFNEVRWGNDVVFSAKIASTLSKCAVSGLPIYCMTESNHTLTKANSLESQVCRLEQECEEVSLTKKRYSSYDSIYYWLYRCWFNVYKLDKYVAIKMLPKTIKSGGIKFIKQLYFAKFR